MLDKLDFRIAEYGGRQGEVEKALGKFQTVSEVFRIRFSVSVSEALEHLFLFLAQGRVLASYLWLRVLFNFSHAAVSLNEGLPGNLHE